LLLSQVSVTWRLVAPATLVKSQYSQWLIWSNVGSRLLPNNSAGLPTKYSALNDSVATTESAISSTANEGSVPTPSSLFSHLKPIFTFGLLLALAGNTIEYAVH